MLFILIITRNSFKLALLILVAFVACKNPESDTSLNTEPPIQFIPKSYKDTVIDAQGNTYPTTKIGEQIWMVENLINTEFDCGDSIQVLVTNGVEIGFHVKFYDDQARYSYYQNNKDLGFGVIYNFSAISKCNFCPKGYRIPTKVDWEALINHLGGIYTAGKRLLNLKFSKVC